MLTAVQSEEPEPPEGESTGVKSNSPPRVTQTHRQLLADYLKIFMEEGEEMRMEEDRATFLVTEALQKI